MQKIAFLAPCDESQPPRKLLRMFLCNLRPRWRAARNAEKDWPKPLGQAPLVRPGFAPSEWDRTETALQKLMSFNSFRRTIGIPAERTGFEPAEGFDPFTDLAN